MENQPLLRCQRCGKTFTSQLYYDNHCKTKIPCSKSFVLFKYELHHIPLKDNEIIVNYQYYDGDYSWIQIVNKHKISDIEIAFKKNIFESKLYDSDTKVIRFTKIRDKKYAESIGFIIESFQDKLKLYLDNKHLNTYDYLKMIDIMDDERDILYKQKEQEVVIHKQNINSQELSDVLYDKDVTDSFCTSRIFCNQNDCMKGLVNVKDKSIQTICIDPPYNIGKDTWDNIDNYNDWLTNVIVALQDKMRDNGSMFIFHNNMEAISELMVSIKQKTRLKFIQMITWNKRYEGSKKKGFLDGYVVKKSAHKWELMAEYILFYTFDNTWKYKDARIQKKVCSKDIQKEVLSKTGGLTGWYGNIETGLNHPTKKTIVPITKHIGLNYDDVVPKFINQKTHHSVWNYDPVGKHKASHHITPKPIDLLENIIKHTTHENDILLDCFAGTGSLGQACLNTNRKCVLIERDNDYFTFIKSQLSQDLASS